MNPKIKVLVVSVGSLVGQNILDTLEYSQFYRRDKVEIIGTNSLAESPNNFRCDACYLVPETNMEDFKTIMTGIIREVMPDLILSSRDEDTAAIWNIMESNPELSGVLPYGNIKTIMYALDKWQTWIFTQKYNLPFAETFMTGQPDGETELMKFADRVQYPLIAKPVRGFASKGVFFLRNWNDAQIASGFEDYIIQEYLGDPQKLEGYFKKMDGLTPLFASAPDVSFNSCYTVISPSGDFSPVFVSQNVHETGRTVKFKKVVNEELEKIMINYARAFHAEGGAGPLGIQFRQDRSGNWKGQEMNHRTNGNTFPRLILGQDELGLIFKTFLPEHDFPLYHINEEAQYDLIYKTLFCVTMKTDSIAELNRVKKWSPMRDRTSFQS